MNKSDIKIYHLYTCFSFLFIVLTTNYLSLNDIIFLANQTDVISYTEIAKIAPSYSWLSTFDILVSMFPLMSLIFTPG